MSLSINSRIGDYQVTDYIGAGGMGQVYRTLHSRLGRVAAIKVLTHIVPGSHAAERFLNEARIQASLHHPNIATLYDFLETDSGPGIIMEYIDGQTLEDRIKQYGRLPLQEVAFIFKALLEAIYYLHKQGIVHRDIKSNNIKIASTGEVKLLDFGIAKDSFSPSLTMIDGCIGTPQYLAPEQIQGKKADQSSDIWALGVVLYEMCLGQLPFPEQSPSLLYQQIISADYQSPESLNQAFPPELASIINHCLHKHPIQRYSSVKAIIRDLDQYITMNSAPGLCIGNQKLMGSSVLMIRKFIGDFWPLAFMFLIMVFVGITWFNINTQVNHTSLENSVTQPVSDRSTAVINEDKSRQQTVRVNVIGEAADVYLNHIKVGVAPYSFKSHTGKTINVQLKRPCFEPLTTEITVQKMQTAYTYRLRLVNTVKCQ